jgi:hypothetical protein
MVSWCGHTVIVVHTCCADGASQKPPDSLQFLGPLSTDFTRRDSKAAEHLLGI